MKMIDSYNPGVYKIINLINGHCYYGSTTTSLHNRYLDHIEDLKRNAHRNNYLQRAWNKYGEENFDFLVLNEMPEKTEFEIRCREQYFLDNFVRWHIDYNLSRSAFTNRHFASEKEIKEGKWDITWEDFEKITYLLQHTNDLCVSIAKQLNIKKELVQRIYNRQSYQKLTENMIFQKRRTGVSEVSLKEDDIFEIFEKYNKGMSAKEISINFNVTEDTIINVLSKRTWKTFSDNHQLEKQYKKISKKGGIKQFSLLKEEINVYPGGVSQITSDIEAQKNISLCCRKGRQRKISYNGFLWCYVGEEYNLPSFKEILLNRNLNSKETRAVIFYDDDWNPLGYSRNIKNITNNNKTWQKEIFAGCISGELVRGFKYKYITDANEKDICSLISQIIK